ncbi:hypothetical protein BGI41_04425 [Methanobrevibacter sp. 87.7]|uniref:zinc ribbon domain-containing protein n=1 Tax=Methanobrevibacter sp. 87.7 TaxID=387957 RepID=UPI000B4FE3B9|nr:zinc ribbon domain-containing protein [Methanobrevibacter sp. 87.7]OWT33055.1 hypothetical protein BGI41_04425 [Methanobrevibacter sp. 87.7]
MEGAKTKFCIYCGKEIPINTKKCPYCMQWQEKEENISRNHFINNYVSPEHEEELKKDEAIKTRELEKREFYDKLNNPEREYSNVLPLRREILLLIFGGKLYTIWWFYKNSTHLKNDYNRNINPGWRTLGFIIPIINWFIYYYLLKDYKEILDKENIESYSPIENTLLYIFIPVIGTFWTFCNVQESINQIWIKNQRNLPVRRSFTNGEIAFMIIIVIVTIIIIISIIAYINSLVNPVATF